MLPNGTDPCIYHENFRKYLLKATHLQGCYKAERNKKLKKLKAKKAEKAEKNCCHSSEECNKYENVVVYS